MDIVGQSKSTIDFADILRSGKIVLFRRASNIDPSIKNLIGTVVLSEFLYANNSSRGMIRIGEQPRQTPIRSFIR